MYIYIYVYVYVYVCTRISIRFAPCDFDETRSEGVVFEVVVVYGPGREIRFKI